MYPQFVTEGKEENLDAINKQMHMTCQYLTGAECMQRGCKTTLPGFLVKWHGTSSGCGWRWPRDMEGSIIINDIVSLTDTIFLTTEIILVQKSQSLSNHFLSLEKYSFV
jgi:hypothetical protein